MPDAGGIGSFASGFAESFGNARKNKTLKQQMQLEDARDREKSALQQRQFQENMRFKQQQAEQLNQYRQQSLGVQQGANESLDNYRQKSLDLEAKKAEHAARAADLQSTEFMLRLFDPKVPKPVRGMGLIAYAKQVGIDPKSDDFKNIAKMVSQFDDETLDTARNSIMAMLPNAQPGDVTAFAKSFISGQMDLKTITDTMGKLSEQKSEQEIIDGLAGTPDQTPGSPTGGSRLLTPGPLATTPGGSLPIPGMTPTAPAAPAGGAPKVSPEQYREGARKALRQGNTTLAEKLLTLARDTEGGGQQGAVGAIPSGYEMQVGTDGKRTMQPIAGSPAALEAEQARKKAEGSDKYQEDMGNIIIQDTNRTLSSIDAEKEWPTGPEIAVRRLIPGDTFSNMEKMLDGVKANISIGSIQKMRENSPTGGALGNVSDKDTAMLERTKGNLDISQPRDVLIDNIKRVNNLTMDLVYGTPAQIKDLVDQGKITAERAAPLMKRQTLTFDVFGNKLSTRPKKGEVRKGYTFTGDDDADPSDQKNWKKVGNDG